MRERPEAQETNFSFSIALSSVMKLLFRTLFFLLSAGVFFVSCHSPNTETPAAAPPKDFHGIPPQGFGGDSVLNIQKNRWAAPANYSAMSVADIIALPHDILTAIGNKARYTWSSAATNQASASESKSVVVTGYIYAAKESSNESCNGDNNSYHDFHIWITASPGEDKSKAIITEATPFWKEQFSGWQLAAFEQLATQNAQVRISGRIMWDEDHPEEIGSTRASLWEVH
ncbi:MAG: hypothetical protein ACHQM6_03360, partial [Candidatus Kapaibacterium sp.]